MMLIPLLLFIMVMYFFFHNSDFVRNHNPTTNERSPMDILKQRYAEGTLSQEEFLHMKEELSKNS